MRTQLVNDAFNLNRANKMSAIKTFQILGYLEYEKENLPWSSFLSHMSFYQDILESTESYGDLQAYLINIIDPIYTKLGWESHTIIDTWPDRKLRTKILSFTCLIDMHDCVSKASYYYLDWMSDPRTNKFVSK